MSKLKLIDIKEALKGRFGPAQRRQAARVAKALRRRAAIILDQGRLAIKAKMLERGYDISLIIPRTVVLFGIVAVFLLWAVVKMWRRHNRSLTKMFVTPKAVDSLAPACSSSARPPLPESSPSPTTAPISLRRCPSQRQTADPPISPLDPGTTATATANPAAAAPPPAASTSADIRALQLGQDQLSKAVASLLAWRTEKEASSPTPHPVDNADADILDDLDNRVTKTEEDLVEVVQEVQRTSLKLDEWAGLPQAHAWVTEMVKSLLAWRAQNLAKESTAPVYATKAEMELANAQARETYEKLAAATGAEVSKVLKELQASYEDKRGVSPSPRRASVTAAKTRPVTVWHTTKGAAPAAKESKDIPLFKRLADGGPASHATQAHGDDE